MQSVVGLIFICIFHYFQFQLRVSLDFVFGTGYTTFLSPVSDCPCAYLKPNWDCFHRDEAEIATSITCFPSHCCCCRCCCCIWFNNNIWPHPVDEWTNARAAFKLQFMCLRRLETTWSASYLSMREVVGQLWAGLGWVQQKLQSLANSMTKKRRSNELNERAALSSSSSFRPFRHGQNEQREAN